MKSEKPRVTSAVVVEKDGKFLLAERNKENLNGHWVFPGGGIRFGETMEEAAIRETKEETNLDVEIVKLLCHKELINVPGKYHSVVFFHLAKPKHTNIRARGDISKAGFFSLQEIKKLKTAESVEMVLREAGFWED